MHTKFIGGITILIDRLLLPAIAGPPQLGQTSSIELSVRASFESRFGQEGPGITDAL
jgi:hypothetical protein